VNRMRRSLLLGIITSLALVSAFFVQPAYAGAAIAAPHLTDYVVTAPAVASTNPTPLTTTKKNGVLSLHIDGTGDHVNFIEVYTTDHSIIPPGTIAYIWVNGSDEGLGGAYVIGEDSYGINVIYDTNFPTDAEVSGSIDGYVGLPTAYIDE